VRTSTHGLRRGYDREKVRRKTTLARGDRSVIIDDESQYFGEPAYNREAHRTYDSLPNREADNGMADGQAVTSGNLKNAARRCSRSKDHPTWMSERAISLTSRQVRGVDSSIKMPSFDGTGDLDILPQRFQTLADFYL